ncbi:choice-of-anchor W domain-containing protein [Chroococcus sp. FPU101]|uniref:choice-of-anchor W domain-containing protein n=1 Tax=Chroococcus sp. FPU101 TaxID=1974212 RepID=UPI001A8D5DBA|nr:choice-of-anchor W domain-containing protein [Chroococcus sp. FPU101]GFE68685.1 hypothetical protein CFPU101_12950 [Chroococcus sp. FPU101]
MNNKILTIPATIGIVIAGVSVLSIPAQAYVLNTIAEGTNPANPFINLPKLFEVEWRAGTHGLGDYEAAIGPNGANVGAANPTIQVDWQRNMAISWSITYNQATGQATFNFNNQTSIYTLPSNLVGLPWDRMGLFANVKSKTGQVVANSRTTLNISTINGETVLVENSPTNVASINARLGTRPTFSRYFEGVDEDDFTTLVPITSVTGTVSIGWNANAPNPQPLGVRGAGSHIAIKLKAYDSPLGEDVGVASVPEPHTLIGLLSVGLLGASLKLKRQL